MSTRYAGYPRAKRSASQLRSYAQADYAKATKFLCFALHAIPDSGLLATLPWNKELAYAPQWTKRGVASLPANASAIAYLMPRSISLLPLPKAIAMDDAPYAIAYDFALASQHSPAGEHYVPVASYYGFTIATLPSHDWLRALSFAKASRPSEALLYADRALLSLATLYPQRIALVEKTERKFQKLLSLYLDQIDQPEGATAFSLALRAAGKAIGILSAGAIGSEP